jgi:hypothetical protein
MGRVMSCGQGKTTFITPADEGVQPAPRMPAVSFDSPITCVHSMNSRL